MAASEARRFWQTLDQQARERLSDDLQRVLDLTWSHRLDHKTNSIAAGNANVYVLYNRILNNWTYAPAGMFTFLERLSMIGRDVEVQCSIGTGGNTQGEDELGMILRFYFGARRAASGFALVNPATFQRIIQAMRGDPNSRLLELMAQSFFHYRRTLAPCSWRIYLNVQPAERATVMRWVVNTVLPGRGCSNAKVGGPGRELRADSIVIYLDDQRAIDLALGGLRAYQSGAADQNRFVLGVPRMVKEIPGLRGVGVGAEPPVALASDRGRLLMFTGSSSFGTYRQQLIELALAYTLYQGEGREAFGRRVVDYFDAAGIDPAHPERHVDPARLRRIAQAVEGYWARRERVPDNLAIWG